MADVWPQLMPAGGGIAYSVTKPRDDLSTGAGGEQMAWTNHFEPTRAIHYLLAWRMRYNHHAMNLDFCLPEKLPVPVMPINN